MPSRQIQLEEVGLVTIVKRRGARNIRLTIQPDGQVRVSLPMWASYQAATEFVKQKRDWITKNQVSKSLIHSGQRIGKAHRLLFVPSPTASKTSARIKDQEIRVTHPAAQALTTATVQAAAHKAALRALRDEAEQLLPRRLRELATHNELPFKSASVRQLKTRWGSCSSQQHITLNYYLMQLPWPLIDYVLVHELVHTKHMNHGPEFWELMERLIPSARTVRKQLKAYRPWLVTY
ncbi:MAG: hypothetical protein JWS12_742 [Candidatus Saccharibacteria bacterium]|nr:hypothetical protein [Candidatus Saccharibacteria bacterium]